MKRLTTGVAVFLMTVGMAVAAGASDGFYWPRSQDSETTVMEDEKGRPDMSAVSGPVETGAVPDRSEGFGSGFYWPRSQDSETTVMEDEKGRPDMSAVSGPVETGALPERSEGWGSGFYWPRSQDSETTTGN